MSLLHRRKFDELAEFLDISWRRLYMLVGALLDALTENSASVKKINVISKTDYDD